jgi:hypothetical protein
VRRTPFIACKCSIKRRIQCRIKSEHSAYHTVLTHTWALFDTGNESHCSTNKCLASTWAESSNIILHDVIDRQSLYRISQNYLTYKFLNLEFTRIALTTCCMSTYKKTEKYSVEAEIVLIPNKQHDLYFEGKFRINSRQLSKLEKKIISLLTCCSSPRVPSLRANTIITLSALKQVSYSEWRSHCLYRIPRKWRFLVTAILSVILSTN